MAQHMVVATISMSMARLMEGIATLAILTAAVQAQEPKQVAATTSVELTTLGKFWNWKCTTSSDAFRESVKS
jgi:hypothetical protein